jgi:hypothetical protein
MDMISVTIAEDLITEIETQCGMYHIQEGKVAKFQLMAAREIGLIETMDFSMQSFSTPLIRFFS